ncbi:MAG: hypothetical protein D6795_01360 [Deltaproteobacteria bacterium]|nr:MAG: hypothetical protein D6795_01360 [Deltaproteobacteria bacterium]
MLLLCLWSLGVGCAGQQIVPEEEHPSIFYPPLPTPPRIQYLTTISTPKDIGVTQGALSKFLFGEDPQLSATIERPYGVALFEGRLYVTDTRGPGYAVFDLDKKKYHFVYGDGPGAMKKPINIVVDRDGTKYVTDTLRKQVLLFDQRDRFLRAYGAADEFKPSDVEIIGDRLYVTDLDHNNVHVLEKKTGKTLFTFGEENQLGWPTNITRGPEGNLYITSTGNAFVKKFAPDGKFLGNVGGLGVNIGKFARPKGVALDREGRLYVVDAAFENVQIFDPSGRLLLFFGEPGSEPHSINLPTSIVIDYDHVSYFQKFADPSFHVDYIIAIASQYGKNKVTIFGFGKMAGIDYNAPVEPPKPKEERPVGSQQP